jgi:hypothetical protein
LGRLIRPFFRCSKCTDRPAGRVFSAGQRSFRLRAKICPRASYYCGATLLRSEIRPNQWSAAGRVSATEALSPAGPRSATRARASGASLGPGCRPLRSGAVPKAAARLWPGSKSVAFRQIASAVAPRPRLTRGERTATCRLAADLRRGDGVGRRCATRWLRGASAVSETAPRGR